MTIKRPDGTDWQCERLVSDYTGFHWFPCSRKAKEMVDGKMYCTQHAKKVRERMERIAKAGGMS